MRRPRFSIFPFILILPLFFMGGILRFIFQIISVLLVIALGIFLIKLLMKAVREKDVEKSDDSYTSNVNKNLDSYFNNNKYFSLSSNLALRSDLSIIYKGLYACDLSDLVSIDVVTSDKINSIITEYENTGVNKYNYNDDTLIVDQQRNKLFNNNINPGPVSKPELADVFEEYDSLFEYVKHFIENVNYGDSNASEYVNGHMQALDKYFEIAVNNYLDMNMFDDKLIDEFDNYESNSIFEKGYYDGLMYCLKAYKKAKELLIKRISKEI